MNEVLENERKKIRNGNHNINRVEEREEKQEDDTTNIKNVFKYSLNCISAVNPFFMTGVLGSRLSKCRVDTVADVYIVDSHMGVKNIRIKPFDESVKSVCGELLDIVGVAINITLTTRQGIINFSPRVIKNKTKYTILEKVPYSNAQRSL
jgi:hypothetical protein